MIRIQFFKIMHLKECESLFSPVSGQSAQDDVCVGSMSRPGRAESICCLEATGHLCFQHWANPLNSLICTKHTENILFFIWSGSWLWRWKREEDLQRSATWVPFTAQTLWSSVAECYRCLCFFFPTFFFFGIDLLKLFVTVPLTPTRGQQSTNNIHLLYFSVARLLFLAFKEEIMKLTSANKFWLW